MSGGVDSSVSALLLKMEGYEVIGLYMKNWEDEHEDIGCSSTRDFEDVANVCNQIGIPFYPVNFTKEYKEFVFAHFLTELHAGNTPNPDILCNREIKFNILLNKAKELGGDYLATGHYACIDSSYNLLKGKDETKDQSYFLYPLKKHILKNVLFPVGELPKTTVRTLARDHRLATANKKDSTGICFIGKREFREFLSHYIPYRKGIFETLEGKALGEHVGAAFYTIGQRKGLGIGGPGDAWFVVGKDMKRNVVFVAQGENHPALYSTSLLAKEATWIQESPPRFPLRASAKIRYRQKEEPCTVSYDHHSTLLTVHFDRAQRAVTPSQSIVFYQGDICLGGAIITAIK